MKRTSFFCLCLCLCILFSACGTPAPEQSSEPAESDESVPVIEDENANLVRAYLEELLTVEWNGVGTAEWLIADRAETIRESVKTLKAPILTEEDVLALADRAVSFFFAAWYGGTALYLPACGVMASFGTTGGGAAPDTGVYGYTQVVAYMVYLFTPPEYVFREADVGREISPDAPPSWPGFYLALAEAGSTPLQAMETLSHGVKGVALLLSELARGDYPLDFRYCEGLTLLGRNGKERPLALLDMALSGDVSLPEAFFAYAERFVGNWIDSFGISPQWVTDYYQMTGSEWEQVSVLFDPETAEQLRKLVQLLPSPLLTRETVSQMMMGAYGMEPSPFTIPILLPGVNGGKDLLLPARGDDTERQYWITLYLLELFTPSAYCYTDLFGRPGRYFALAGEEDCYALLMEGRALYLVDGAGNLTSLYDVAEEGGTA